MKKIFIAAILLLPFSLFAQQPQSKESQSPSEISTPNLTAGDELPEPSPGARYAEEHVFNFVEAMPEFPGGMEAMKAYISKNIQYPSDALEEAISGKVYVTFVVEKEGQISEVKVLRNLYPSLDKEALRVVMSMPNWKPGMQNGKPVRVKYNLPVYFILK